jgi:hypothetical protein
MCDSSSSNACTPGNVAEGRRSSPVHGWWSRAWRIGKAALIAFLLIVVAAMFLENSLIFFPMPYPAGD